MNKIIGISAVSNIFEFSAQVPEKNAEKVLKFILKSFQYLKNKNERQIQVTTLKVKTWIVNPELM